MEASGCINVDIGAESGSNRILEMIDKQITVEDMLEVNRRIAQYNIIVKYTFIVGFPTETRQEMLSTVRTAIQLVKEIKRPILRHLHLRHTRVRPCMHFQFKTDLSRQKNLRSGDTLELTAGTLISSPG